MWCVACVVSCSDRPEDATRASHAGPEEAGRRQVPLPAPGPGQTVSQEVHYGTDQPLGGCKDAHSLFPAQAER